MKKILIGIPVLNNLEMTRACLQHLVKNTQVNQLGLDVSIFILDNGSIDNIATMLHEDFPNSPFPIYYRKNPKNLGVGIAWNQILRFSPENIPSKGFDYNYYVIANNDAMVCEDWLQPMVEAMDSDTKIGWISALENGSPVLEELVEAHTISKEYRVDPSNQFTTDRINSSISNIYSKWGGHNSFCTMIKKKELPSFLPFKKDGRSAVFFMVRPAMIEQIGFFDEDFWPIGIAEDLEYFLRMEKIMTPNWLTDDIYPDSEKWKAGFCGKTIVHHNWCSTRQGKNFDGRKWDKMREKHWKKKFKKSKKYYTKLFK